MACSKSHHTQQIPMKRARGKDHNNNVVHGVSTNRYNCMCFVNHVCTETGKQSTDGSQCRHFDNLGHRILGTHTSFLYLWMMFTTVNHPSSLHPSRSSSLDISNVKPSAFRGNTLSSQKRDRSLLVKKMSYRTIHPKKSCSRERFFPCLLRRGVPPTQRHQSDTEIPTWVSICCAHDIQSFPQTRKWKS